MRKKHQGKGRNFLVTPLKIGVAFVLAMAVLTGLVLVAANAYLQSNRQKIFNRTAFLNEGILSFDKASVSIWRDFPNASIVLQGVTMAGLQPCEDERPVLNLKELRAVLSLKEWRRWEFELKTIQLADGQLTVQKDLQGHYNWQGLLSKGRSAPVEHSKIKVNREEVRLVIRDVMLSFRDRAKSTNITTSVKFLKSRIHFDRNGFAADMDVKLRVKELVLKEENGSFLKNSSIEGRIALTGEAGELAVAPTNVKINGEPYLISMDVAPGASPSTQIKIENRQSRFAAIVPLLSDNVREALNPYHVAGDFFASATVDVLPGQPTRVDIDLEMPGNDVSIYGHFFRRAVAKGRFVNSLYDDDRYPAESKGNVRLHLSSIQANYGGLQLESKDVLVTATPETQGWIKAETKISGAASVISSWLGNRDVVFDGGTFSLTGNVDGPIGNFGQMILSSTADVDIRDLLVSYRQAEVAIPLEHLQLKKVPGETTFSIVSSTFLRGHDYRLDGGLRNVAALLVEMAELRASSEVDLYAQKLGWEDMVDLFGTGGYFTGATPKSEREKKKSMKQVVRALEHHFQPTLSIALDTLSYRDKIDLIDFRTGLHFNSGGFVILDSASFVVDSGQVTLATELDISRAHETPFALTLKTRHIDLQKMLPPLGYFNVQLLAAQKSHPRNLDIDMALQGVIDDVRGLRSEDARGVIRFRSNENKKFEGRIAFKPVLTPAKEKQKMLVNTTIEIEGDPFLFNDFFNNQKFLFLSRGRFGVRFEYVGDVTSTKELFNRAKCSFFLEQGAVYDVQSDLTIPLSRIDLEMDRDIAKLELLIRSDSLDQQVKVKGEVVNMSELVLGKTGKHFQAKASVHSPRLVWKDVTTLFAKPTDANRESKPFDAKMKSLIKSMLNTFDPELDLRLDTLVYSPKLMLLNLKTGCEMKDSNHLVLQETGFDFHRGSIALNAELDLNSQLQTPFVAHFRTKDLDVGALMRGLDYLGIKALKETEKLKGNITLNLDLESAITAGGKRLIPEETEAELDFDLYGVEIQGLSFIDRIAEKVRKRKRFRQVLFAPITNSLSLKGKRILIPQMEIQSNAIDMFVEGEVDPPNDTNVWLSIPLDNLKKRDGNLIPDKRGYAASKNKIYLEITSTGKMKLHLSKRKFYEQRGMAGAFEAFRRKNRHIRKENRREMKKDNARQ